MDLKELKVTYEELFELMEWDQERFHETQNSKKDIYVNTPNGYKLINAGVVKNDLDMYNIKFEDNTECNVADNHIFSIDGKEIFAKDADYVDVINGKMKIISKEYIGKHNGYDINIDNPHWYYSPNGVIYHNTLLMTDLISGLIKQGKNILLISLEMADKEMMKRIHANAMDLPINSLLDLSKTEGEKAKITERPLIDKQQVIDAYNRLKTSGSCGKFFVKDYPSGAFSALMLEQLVESYQIEKNIKFDIVFIDYLGIMKSDIKSPNTGLYEYVKSIAEEVRASAKKLQLPIVSASQLNRSSVGKTDDVDNSAVSDSMGTVMTADFMMFLLQSEEMKERKEIVCKVTKNRFAGRTDTWMMNIDYEHMRFSDMIVQDNSVDAGAVLDITDGVKPKPMDDFGIITAEKQEKAEAYAKQEIKDIVKEDMTKVIQMDKANKDPFSDSIDDIFKELGI